MVKELDDESFNKKIKKGKVVVDCYATWCGPCKMLSPVIDALSKEIKEYTFYKIDIDYYDDIAEEYSIMTIPTLLIFNDGQLINTLIGYKTKEELKEILKEE